MSVRCHSAPNREPRLVGVLPFSDWNSRRVDSPIDKLSADALARLLPTGPRVILGMPEGETLCRALNLDPAGTISSGVFLLPIDSDHVADLLDACQSEQIPIYELGHVFDGPVQVTDFTKENITHSDRDEIARLFE